MNDLLSYRDGGAGFQAHSSTSRRAAHGRPNSGGQREYVFDAIQRAGSFGCTTDEARRELLANKVIHENSVISARMIELEDAGRIIKTTVERRTSAGHAANVYVTADVFQRGGFSAAPVKERKEEPNRRRVTWFRESEYHEDDGFVMWHLLPVSEPPYVGNPNSEDWPAHYEGQEENLRWAYLPAAPVK